MEKMRMSEPKVIQIFILFILLSVLLSLHQAGMPIYVWFAADIILSVPIAGLMFLLLICTDLYFDEEYVYFGRNKVLPYSELEEVKTYFKDGHRVMKFKTRSAGRFYVSFGKLKNGKLEVLFSDLLEQKSSMEKQMIRENM